MRWFEESEDVARALNFRDVTEKGPPPDLSWTRGAKPLLKKGEVLSLRPPRLPEIAPESFVGATLARELEEEEVSGLHPAPTSDIQMSEPVVPETQEFEAFAPERQRKDTMIDDIVPRAEEEAISSIHKALERTDAERAEFYETAEERLVELSLLVARRVIAREVSLDPKIVRQLVREGISALGERDRTVVRVGTFFAEMGEHLQTELSTSKMHCEVIVDPTLSPTGCIVETDLGRVDESIETRLSNLIETLSFDARRKKK
jgi:flagellar assembly protein FliH